MAFTTPDAAALPRYPVIIGGERAEGGSGASLPHVYPGTGTVTREIAMARLVTRWIAAEHHAGTEASSTNENAMGLTLMPELCAELAASIRAEADPAQVLAILRQAMAKPKNRATIADLIRRMGAE